MSKKSKYKAKHQSHDGYYDVVDAEGWSICTAFTQANARKIARALNAMEDKPKAKGWKFDWSLAELRFNFAAMDFDGTWYLFEVEPRIDGEELWIRGGKFREIRGIKPYPGDWRDSLQKRP